MPTYIGDEPTAANRRREAAFVFSTKLCISVMMRWRLVELLFSR